MSLFVEIFIKLFNHVLKNNISYMINLNEINYCSSIEPIMESTIISRSSSNVIINLIPDSNFSFYILLYSRLWQYIIRLKPAEIKITNNKYLWIKKRCLSINPRKLVKKKLFSIIITKNDTEILEIESVGKSIIEFLSRSLCKL